MTKQTKINSEWNDFWQDTEAESELRNSKFWTKPVSAKTFFEDWLGFKLFPRQYKVIESVFANNFKDINSLYHEFVIAWGKRSGKDIVIAHLLSYLIYFLLCLNNPQKYLGIQDGEPIDIVNVSFDSDQAKSVFFEKFVRAIKGAINPVDGKNFFESVGMDIDKSVLKNSIEFPKNIRAFSLNSKEFKAEGKNVVFAVFDEIGSFRFDKAEKIRKHIKSTAKPTSPKFYKLFYISFLTSGNDYMAYLLNRAKQMKNVFFDRAATWDVRSGKNCPQELKRFVVHKVDYQEEYDEDSLTAMLMYECKIPKFRANALIKSPERITNCINMDRPSPIIGLDQRLDDNLENPYEQFWTTEILEEEFEPWFRPNYVWEIWDLEKQYEKSSITELAEKIRVLKERHDNADYFAHIDLSRGIVDCAGLVFGHTYKVLNTTKVYVDLAIQIRAPKGEDGVSGEIDMETILDFVIDFLKKKKRFKIKQLTLDGWNSAIFISRCNKNKIPAEILSIDKTTAPYETAKDFLYREDVNLYYYPPLIRELTELEVKPNKKIDHPANSQWRMREEKLPRGSKDVSDCLAGIIHKMMEEEDDEPLAYGAK